MRKKLPNEVAAILKSYVYIYIDPSNGELFYIGKGKGDRLFSHLNDEEDSEKVERIKKIRQSGREPQIDILRYGLSDAEAALTEAAAIDLIGKKNLANQISGIGIGFGRITSQDLITMYTAKPVIVRHKAILITINKLYRSNMTRLELYEATRGIWVIGPRRNNAEYAMAVYQGIVREVYRIKKWYPAVTLKYKTRTDIEKRLPVKQERWEFSGKVAYDIRNRYIDKSVGMGNQNPIRYVNV